MTFKSLHTKALANYNVDVPLIQHPLCTCTVALASFDY
jgi:hypothetical protein